MKELPILFSGEMVRAILAGRKTQTRRVGKIQNAGYQDLRVEGSRHAVHGWQALATYASYPGKGTARTGICCCPYGVPGDRLWVREEHFLFGHWEQVEGVFTKSGKQKWKFVQESPEVVFDKAELNGHQRSGVIKIKGKATTSDWHKRLARFMPRELSRITLEIVAVRVERLQSITEEDAMAEGIFYHKPDGIHHSGYRYDEFSPCHGTAVNAYSWLWEKINGPGSWALNPWVWVVEFKRVEA